jgi:hypothetical protein
MQTGFPDIVVRIAHLRELGFPKVSPYNGSVPSGVSSFNETQTLQSTNALLNILGMIQTKSVRQTWLRVLPNLSDTAFLELPYAFGWGEHEIPSLCIDVKEMSRSANVYLEISAKAFEQMQTDERPYHSDPMTKLRAAGAVGIYLGKYAQIAPRAIAQDMHVLFTEFPPHYPAIAEMQLKTLIGLEPVASTVSA